MTSGEVDVGIRYDDLCHLLTHLGFSSTQAGCHNIFRMVGRDLINLQYAGGKTKSYQFRQIKEHLTEFKK